MTTPEELRTLAAAAAAAGTPQIRAVKMHALGEALEPHSPRHARSVFAASIGATHNMPSHDSRIIRDVPLEERLRARSARVGLPRGTWARRTAIRELRRLHAQQHPTECATAPLLLVPIWPCCEGLASIVHSLAAALAQGAWTGATVLPFVAGCEQPHEGLGDNSCSLYDEEPDRVPPSTAAALLHGLLPLTHCTLRAALDEGERASLARLVTALGGPAHARPRGAGSAAALAIEPGERRRTALGATASRCALTVLASEHFANVAALVAPHSDNDDHSDHHDDYEDRPSVQNALWLSVLVSFVLTPHPEVWARLSPRLSPNHMHGVAGTSQPHARALVVALHLRHGDKSHEPWRAPRLQLRAFLRKAATALEPLLLAAGMGGNLSDVQPAPLLFVASDNASVLTELKALLRSGSKRPQWLGASLQGARLMDSHPVRVEGTTLPRLRADLKVHRSAPSVAFFSASPPLQRALRMAALEDLLLLAESDAFVGTASSHYSAVAGALRIVRGRVGSFRHGRRSDLPVPRGDPPPPRKHPPWPPGSPPCYADEAKLARGSYSVGLFHAANLGPEATETQKVMRWSIAASRLEQSANVVQWREGGRQQRGAAIGTHQAEHCHVDLARAVHWQHSPWPLPAASRRSFECVWRKLRTQCRAWARAQQRKNPNSTSANN